MDHLREIKTNLEAIFMDHTGRILNDIELYKVIQIINIFGGKTWNVPVCKNCNTRYHQIFTIDLKDPKVQDLSIEGIDEFPLVSCLNCSTCWEPQLFKIDFIKKKIDVIKDTDFENWCQDVELRIPSPLPEYRVTLNDMTNNDIPIDKETYYNIFESFGMDYIFRLLGAPLYVQSPINRECPICKNEMTFVGSIISQDYETDNLFDNVEMFFGEMSLYFFFCKHCHVIKTESQST